MYYSACNTRGEGGREGEEGGREGGREGVGEGENLIT